jgi:hypothetical protein
VRVNGDLNGDENVCVWPSSLNSRFCEALKESATRRSQGEIRRELRRLSDEIAILILPWARVVDVAPIGAWQLQPANSTAGNPWAGVCRIALVDRDNPDKEVRFAGDSPLEGEGFEPSVPRERGGEKAEGVGLSRNGKCRKSRTGQSAKHPLVGLTPNAAAPG